MDVMRKRRGAVPIISQVHAKGHGVKVKVDLAPYELVRGDRLSLTRSVQPSQSVMVRLQLVVYLSCLLCVVLCRDVCLNLYLARTLPKYTY